MTYPARRPVKVSILSVLVMATAIPFVLSPIQRAETIDSQYLIFGMNVAAPHPPPASAADYDRIFYPFIDSHVADIINKIGATGDETHQLGFMVILPVWEWNSGLGPNHTALDEFIKEAFVVALKRSVAVYFTIDSNYGTPLNIHNWWDPNAPGYNPDNKNNVEWTNWDGTPTKARYSLQGSGAKLPPVLCYNSPKILSESSYLAAEVIAPAVLQGLNDLQRAGKAYLFAGITLSLELSLDNYTVIDKLDPALASMMETDGAVKGQLGYCALTNLGYSRSNPPFDYADALAKVNQSYAAFWAEQLMKAGISKDKLYGHVAVVDGTMLQYTNAPIWTAFNDYSRPGWTTYMAGPIANNLNVLYQALAEHGNPHWASTEASPTSLTGLPLNPENYLAWHYNHGASLVMINAEDPSSGGQVIGKDIWRSASIMAYQKFLSSTPLLEG